MWDNFTIKVNSNTIELIVQPSCYCILDLLFVTQLISSYICVTNAKGIFLFLCYFLMIKQLFKWARKYWYKEIRTVWRTQVQVELDALHYSAKKIVLLWTVYFCAHPQKCQSSTTWYKFVKSKCLSESILAKLWHCNIQDLMH